MPTDTPPIFSTPPQLPTIGTQTPPALKKAFPGYGQLGDLAENWRIKFMDADGIPLNMLSFEVIDFGAIAYKEIFQNVKTILATPLFSAALERLLGIDQSIVDLPIDQASTATIAIIDALYFWEPRVEIVNIRFDGDVINGHLICNLQLKVRNVIFGTDAPYDRNNIFETPTRVTQKPPISQEPVKIVVEGPAGEKGQRGSLWFVGTTDPTTRARSETPRPRATGTEAQGEQGEAGERASQWFTGADNPPSVARSISEALPNDMYLNTTTGDVFQFDGTTWHNLGQPSP